jgi:uncharacterized protein
MHPKEIPLKGQIITDEKLAKYFDITTQAQKKVKIIKRNTLSPSAGKDFFDMASRYISDAKHFESCGDKVNAFAALNYAHGWLDAGARIGVFDVDADNVLFTVDSQWIDSLDAQQTIDELQNKTVFTQQKTAKNQNKK